MEKTMKDNKQVAAKSAGHGMGTGNMSGKVSEEDRLAQLIASCRFDPERFAKIAYEWNEGDLEGSSGPRQWQSDVMGDIKAHLSNPVTRFKPLRIAVASGHGIGKSALVSILVNWAMSTCVDCKVVITASTSPQLETKTMPEVIKWFRRSINAHWFKPTATAISAVDEGHERTWRTDALTWSENNTEAFAGLHNKKRRILLIFDEASSIASKVWEVAEGAMTDEDTEIIWLAFGNPTQNTGRFRECFGSHKRRWITRQIDSRKVPGVNKEEIQGWIDTYGEDSDFVRVRVKGEFPRSGTMQFIASDVVDAARTREAVHGIGDVRVMSVDVARFGDDDSVICKRIGRDARSHPMIRLRGVDTMTLAARIVDEARVFKPDAIFVDGGGVGGGVVDRLNMLRLPVVEVQFGGRADRSSAVSEGAVVYANKRAEIWGYMRDWLKGGAIPDEPGLAAELVGVEYGYVQRDGKDSIMLEKKADMKKRGLSSPDAADALAIGFAYPVVATDHTDVLRRGSGVAHQSAYDPLAREYVARDLGGEQGGGHQSRYDSLSLEYLNRNS